MGVVEEEEECGPWSFCDEAAKGEKEEEAVGCGSSSPPAMADD